jgi:hypothetical protein
MDRQSMRGFLAMIARDFPGEILRIREPAWRHLDSPLLTFLVQPRVVHLPLKAARVRRCDPQPSTCSDHRRRRQCEVDKRQIGAFYH